MDEMEYRTTIMVIKTACGRKGFKNFMKNGVNKAKGVIVKALTEKPLGLSYLELNNRVAAFFSNERWEAAVWKMDSFVVALAGLEWEDKKIKVERGIYTLLVDNGKEDKSTKGYKHIVREDIPCWYELSWLKEKTSIILRIHKDFIKTARVIPQDAPIVKDFMESFAFLWSDGETVEAFRPILGTMRDEIVFGVFDETVLRENPKMIGIKFGAAHIAHQRRLIEERGYALERSIEIKQFSL